MKLLFLPMLRKYIQLVGPRKGTQGKIPRGHFKLHVCQRSQLPVTARGRKICFWLSTVFPNSPKWREHHLHLESCWQRVWEIYNSSQASSLCYERRSIEADEKAAKSQQTIYRLFIVSFNSVSKNYRWGNLRLRDN